MSDQQSEKEQILADVLGFDPNESQGPDSSSTPSNSHPERRDWPENWREMFIAQQDSPLIEHVDVDNLFTVSKPFSVVEAYGESIQRDYYGFNPDTKDKRKPQNINCLVLPAHNQENGYFSFQIGKEGGDSEYIRISFNPSDDLELEQSAYDFIRMGVGDRSLRVGFNRKGNIEIINFNIESDTILHDEGSVPEVYYDPKKISIYKFFDKWRVSGEKSVGEIEYEEFSDENRLVARRVQNGEVKDEIEVPLKIDPEELKKRWLSKELLENPGDPNTKLDETWRRIDFFHDAGLRWDAVADDRLHSLTRTPPPAE